VSQGNSVASVVEKKTGTALSFVAHIFVVGFECRLMQLSWSLILYYGRFAPFGYEKEPLLRFLKIQCFEML